MTQTALPSRLLGREQPAAVKPLHLPGALLLFGIPAAVLAAAIWIVWPALMSAGMSRGGSNALVFISFNTLLGLAAVIAYRAEGNPLNWKAFITRFRLQVPRGRIWLWALGGFLVVGVVALAMNTLSVMVYNLIGFTMPDQSAGSIAAGLQLAILVTNILGEELWWRGYILPRQELVYGRSTWIIHGLLWACFHAFKPWAVIPMFFVCPIYAFVAQRSKNNWTTIIMHFLINGAGMVMAVLA